MSFSSETKQEITHIELDKKCCQLAEIAGFVRMCGSITLIGGKMGVRLTTDSPATARLFAKLLKSYFDTKADLNVEDTTPLKKGHAYQLIITPDMNADLILRETGILGVKEGSNYITDGIPADLIRKKCCKKAYLRGIFLGAGTIIFQKNVVRGLTTAAGLWVTAAIGLACGTGMYVAAAITTMMVLMGLEVLNYLIPQLGTSTIELNFSAPSRDSVKEFISKIKQKGMEVHSYELKERRFSKEEFVEASIEIKAKRGFHTLEILDYMNDFSDVTISTIK